MPRFRDIPPFTCTATYRIDVGWDYLKSHMEHADQTVNGGLQTDAAFQRAHVWTAQQQIRYVEFVLCGGLTGKDLYWNCPKFTTGSREGPYVLVDGKQRLTAVLRFLDNEIHAFGYRFSEYADRLDPMKARFSWWVNDLETHAEVLQWYLDLNRGGVVHTDEEIEKVVRLLETEKEQVTT